MTEIWTSGNGRLFCSNFVVIRISDVRISAFHCNLYVLINGNVTYSEDLLESMPGAELGCILSNLSNVPAVVDVEDFWPTRRFLTMRFTSFFLFTIFVFFFFSPVFEAVVGFSLDGEGSFNSVSKSLRNFENSSTSSRQSTFKMSSSLFSVVDEASCLGVSAGVSPGAKS